MKFKAKDRMALVNKKNMKRLTAYFDREGCIDFDLSWAVNHLIDNALKEITLRELEAIEKDMACNGCEYAVQCNNEDDIYYCDHEDRIDDMGKLSIGNMLDASPEWCPRRVKKNYRQIKDGLEDIIKMEADIALADKYGNRIEVKVPRPEYVRDSIF